MFVNLERCRVRDWVAAHRLGGDQGNVFGFHGTCSTPIELAARGLPDKLLVSLRMEAETPLVGIMRVRCRKCPECRLHRARLWAARAQAEVSASGRTWFATLTLSPDNLMRTRMAMERRAIEAGWLLHEMPPQTKFMKLCDEVNPEITKFLKRVRKNSGARIRYLCVAEEHNSDKTAEDRRHMPHWHMLMHENVGRVTERQLSAAWRFGHSQFRLVHAEGESRTPYYITKYLTKGDTEVRIRASEQYGRNALRTITERIEGALTDFVSERNEANETATWVRDPVT